MLITPIVGLAVFAVSWSFSAEAADAADTAGSVAPSLRLLSSSAPVAVSAASPPIASSAQSSEMDFRSVLRQEERREGLGFGRRVGFHFTSSSTFHTGLGENSLSHQVPLQQRSTGMFSSTRQGRVPKSQHSETEGRAGWRNGGTAGAPRSGQRPSMELRAGVRPVLIRAVCILLCALAGRGLGWLGFAALFVRPASFKFWACRRTKRPSHQTGGLLQ